MNVIKRWINRLRYRYLIRRSDEMLEFTIYPNNYRDVLKYHKGRSCTVDFEQGEYRFSNVSAVCIYKRKQKDGSSIVKFRITEKG